MEIDVGGVGSCDNVALEVEPAEEEQDEDGSEDVVRRRGEREGRGRSRKGRGREARGRDMTFGAAWVEGSGTGDNGAVGAGGSGAAGARAMRTA